MDVVAVSAAQAKAIAFIVGVDKDRKAPGLKLFGLESPEALANAEVRVELRGAVGLDGYAGQRELRWSTDLDRGVNQLTLPVVASDASGGQVVVEVIHGDKRRTFVLDVRTVVPG